MAEKEQVKPLAPSPLHIRSDQHQHPGPMKSIPLHERKYIKFCGCVAAIFLIIAVTLLVLSFTIFHVKEPVIRMNRVTLQQQLVLTNGTLHPDSNATILAEISIKNPNIASFRYNEGTTTVFFVGSAVGEEQIPSGVVKPKRTVHMNVTVNIIPVRLLSVPNLKIEIGNGALNLSSNTIVDGKVKIIGIMKKHVVIKVNWGLIYNITSHDIQYAGEG